MRPGLQQLPQSHWMDSWTCLTAMAKSNWDTVTVLCKKGTKSKQAILAALGQGEDVETSKKWAAGQNKQHLTGKTTAKLDQKTKELHHHRVTLEVGGQGDPAGSAEQGADSEGLSNENQQKAVAHSGLQEWTGHS